MGAEILSAGSVIGAVVRWLVHFCGWAAFGGTIAAGILVLAQQIWYKSGHKPSSGKGGDRK